LSNTWKTPKGTTLFLLDLRGKPYLPVAERLIWFREEKPNWTIETEIKPTDSSCLGAAWIKDESGRTIAMAHKFENKQGFADFIEKSETGAVGRALAMCGYGTQFCADELDEGERIVDAPANKPANKMQSAGDFVMPFGKQKGQTLNQLGASQVSQAVKWVKQEAKPEFRDSKSAKEFIFWADAYLKKNPISELDSALNDNFD
jgi:hypothetical protein